MLRERTFLISKVKEICNKCVNVRMMRFISKNSHILYLVACLRISEIPEIPPFVTNRTNDTGEERNALMLNAFRTAACLFLSSDQFNNIFVLLLHGLNIVTILLHFKTIFRYCVVFREIFERQIFSEKESHAFCWLI